TSRPRRWTSQLRHRRWWHEEEDGAMRARFRLIVVRHSERTLLMTILNSLNRWPAQTGVMVDRRVRERRVLLQQVTVERRRHQRRAEAPAMWYLRGFLVVETDHLPVEAIQLGG